MNKSNFSTRWSLLIVLILGLLAGCGTTGEATRYISEDGKQMTTLTYAKVGGGRETIVQDDCPINKVDEEVRLKVLQKMVAKPACAGDSTVQVHLGTTTERDVFTAATPVVLGAATAGAFGNKAAKNGNCKGSGCSGGNQSQRVEVILPCTGNCTPPAPAGK